MTTESASSPVDVFAAIDEGPTVFGSRNQPWSEIRTVMGTERIPAGYVLDFPGGTGGVESLLRLGDSMGVHIVLAPV